MSPYSSRKLCAHCTPYRPMIWHMYDNDSNHKQVVSILEEGNGRCWLAMRAYYVAPDKLPVIQSYSHARQVLRWLPQYLFAWKAIRDLLYQYRCSSYTTALFVRRISKKINYTHALLRCVFFIQVYAFSWLLCLILAISASAKSINADRPNALQAKIGRAVAPRLQKRDWFHLRNFITEINTRGQHAITFGIDPLIKAYSALTLETRTERHSTQIKLVDNHGGSLNKCILLPKRNTWKCILSFTLKTQRCILFSTLKAWTRILCLFWKLKNL